MIHLLENKQKGTAGVEGSGAVKCLQMLELSINDSSLTQGRHVPVTSLRQRCYVSGCVCVRVHAQRCVVGDRH